MHTAPAPMPCPATPAVGAKHPHLTRRMSHLKRYSRQGRKSKEEVSRQGTKGKEEVSLSEVVTGLSCIGGPLLTPHMSGWSADHIPVHAHITGPGLLGLEVVPRPHQSQVRQDVC